MAQIGRIVIKARVVQKGFFSVERQVLWQKLKFVQKGSDTRPATRIAAEITGFASSSVRASRDDKAK